MDQTPNPIVSSLIQRGRIVWKSRQGAAPAAAAPHFTGLLAENGHKLIMKLLRYQWSNVIVSETRANPGVLHNSYQDSILIGSAASGERRGARRPRAWAPPGPTWPQLSQVGVPRTTPAAAPAACRCSLVCATRSGGWEDWRCTHCGAFLLRECSAQSGKCKCEKRSGRPASMG